MDASVICAKIARMKNSFALAALLGLSACQPQDPNGRPAPPPEDAPAAVTAPAPPSVLDISQPIRAVGTEPFWSLAIDGTTLTLTRPEGPPLVAAAPGAALQPGQAVWVAKAADGRQMTVTLRDGGCSDGMSDLKYPMNAEIVLLNESLHGCAAKASEMPRETPAR
ncbi:hypothetical protein [Phenylobacterium sp.]|uniref:COG3650 family protein n=1 Tax=Phenylobacterium sp. TaxID=1871053 RepID=UPI0025DA7021|nr:hypothetical protein [Phenylobacterium sp.]